MSADRLYALGHDEVMLRMAGQTRRIAGKLDYLRDEIFRGRFDANPLHHGPGL